MDIDFDKLKKSIERAEQIKKKEQTKADGIKNLIAKAERRG